MLTVHTVTRSEFYVRKRATASFAITAIAATIDHGDESDITDFVESQSADPVIGPLLAGGEMRWESGGIIALLLTDDGDIKQPLMQNFLFMAMVSGRFRPSEGTQKLIWADPVTGAQPQFPPVPEEWWVELDAGTAPPGDQFLAWYMAWLAGQ